MASPNLKENKMSVIKGLVGKHVTREVSFMGEKVKIKKLSVAQVLEIQNMAKTNENEEDGMKILRSVIGMSVEGGEDLSIEDFATFPMDELSKLSNEIMKFSGIGENQGK